MTYLALLRGINVGGKSLIKMDQLRAALAQAGFKNVRTYIQSGNVFFEFPLAEAQTLTQHVEATIAKTFGLQARTIVFTKYMWHRIIASAPPSWGTDTTHKHNLFIVLPPLTTTEVMAAIGKLDPALETVVPGDGVVYQSLSLKLVGRTTSSKLASSPIFQRITIRNYNTATKLLTLF